MRGTSSGDPNCFLAVPYLRVAVLVIRAASHESRLISTLPPVNEAMELANLFPGFEIGE